jgi:hypothetical protein
VRGRPGFALVVSLLLVVGLAAIGAGVVVLGAREYDLASAAARRSSARAAAESAVRHGLAEWSTRGHEKLSVGEAADLTTILSDEVAVPPAALSSWTVLRLDSALFLVQGEGRVDGPDGPADPRGAVGRAGALVRTISPGPLATAFPAAATAEREARIEGGSVWGSGSCRTVAPVPAVLAPSVHVAPGANVTGQPPVLLADPPPVPDPDPFTDPLLAALATTTIEGGAVTPRPRTTADRCEPGPLNWGAVSTSSPCHTLLPFVHAAGHLTVRGGEGRALLVVDGDLTLEATRFDGLILVRGQLIVGPGTAVRGAVRATTVRVNDGSITYDVCRVEDALAAGGLDRPFPHPDRLWIPLF